MNKRILKLVNDERKSLTVRSAKGCITGDVCITKDNDTSCSISDACNVDNAGCGISPWDSCGRDN